MGILNVTPDSFSDGGDFTDPGRAVAHALQMVAEGAALIDIGGESTRPGATPVPLDEELRRLMPTVSAVAAATDVPISVDTSQPEVIRAVADAGAQLVNDVRALQRPGAVEAVAELGLAASLMHMRGEPGLMQQTSDYPDGVVVTVRDFLAARLANCTAAGLPAERLLLDPGFGFGKTLPDNLALLAALDDLGRLGRPLLVGLSRKSMIGAILDAPVGRRLHGGVAAAVLAVSRGARLVRTHDVAATVEALAVCAAVEAASSEGATA
ncbi:MAG: dihydropteroate synthase [Gammaproteobacteria bacterium]|nr:MAG: dihydropteroate synthase [Gammaproteobacteria bacterium]